MYYQYDKMGNVTSLTRSGERDNNHYGTIDILDYSYDGNQVVKVSDKESGPHFKGAFHFVDGADEDITSTQRYKYNGKELDRMFGIDSYDYGARMYDPCMIRWRSLDPLCEKYYSISPYAYCANDPINNLDKDGKEKIDALPPNNRKTKGLQSEIESFRDDPSIINIWGHGIAGENLIKLNKTRINNASDFKDFLDKNSLVWQAREGDTPVTIVLHACSSASLAKEISEDKRFKNVTIVGPTEPISVLYGQKSKKVSASFLDNNGIWVSYKDGKSIKGQEYGKYDKPGSIIPKI